MKVLDLGCGKGLKRREALEQSGSYHIHPRVGALSRKAHRKQQLIVLFILQRTFRRRICKLQQPDDLRDLFR